MLATALSMTQNGSIDKFVALYEEELSRIVMESRFVSRPWEPKFYVDSVKKHDVVFGIGPGDW